MAFKRLLIGGVFILSACLVSFSGLTDSPEETEKQVTIYNSYGYLSDGVWQIPLLVRIYEKPNLLARATGKGIREIIQQKANIEELNQAQKLIFKERAAGFLLDNESDEMVWLEFENDPEGERFQINGQQRSDRNGRIEGLIKLNAERAAQLLHAQKSERGWLKIKAVSSEQAGEGFIQLVPEKGLSVISDIDDTVKVTNIPFGSAEVLNNTFFKPFVAAPGMADAYQAFDGNVTFHYISGGPWQLYQPLSEFLFSDEAGFPRGSLHMKNVRTNPFESESYDDISKLISGGSKKATFTQKVSQLSTLFTRFPHRQFILIGDSGELDPEIYQHIKKLFPQQVHSIRIRDVVNARQCNPKRLEDMTIIAVDTAANLACEKLK